MRNTTSPSRVSEEAGLAGHTTRHVPDDPLDPGRIAIDLRGRRRLGEGLDVRLHPVTSGT